MKRSFLWGSATAAYQCEGAWNRDGKGESQWDRFCHDNSRNVNHESGDIASDFYDHYEEDIRTLAAGGQNTFRFSIAWTRIFPDSSEQININGIKYYNSVINTCIRYHVEPFATLQHYDIPQYLAEKGGWTTRDILEPFCHYAKTCFELFGDRVKLWSTQNEIRYFAHCAYLQGNYPPHHIMDFQSYSQAIYYSIVASAMAIYEYRKQNLSGSIGVVHACGAIQTLNNTPEDKKAANNANLYYIRSILDPAVNGIIPLSLIKMANESGINTSFIKQEDIDILKHGTADFIGLNIYSRNLVKPYVCGNSSVSFNNAGKSSTKQEGEVIKNWFATDNDVTKPKNQWGREVYPQCIYDTLKYISNMYPEIPIYVTENGIASYDELHGGIINDEERIKSLKQFVNWVVRAYEDGIDIRGYYLWSTIDLYSWINGYNKRYGLVYIDYDDKCRRIPKESYYWYHKYIDEFYKKHPEAIPE